MNSLLTNIASANIDKPVQYRQQYCLRISISLNLLVRSPVSVVVQGQINLLGLPVLRTFQNACFYKLFKMPVFKNLSKGLFLGTFQNALFLKN